MNAYHLHYMKLPTNNKLFTNLLSLLTLFIWAFQRIFICFLFQNAYNVILRRRNAVMKVNKTLYVLCAIFLGGIGIHKFYADKVIQGVLHLLFFWTFIPTIISIIHGILVIFNTKADKDGYIIIPRKN